MEWDSNQLAFPGWLGGSESARLERACVLLTVPIGLDPEPSLPTLHVVIRFNVGARRRVWYNAKAGRRVHNN